jgi:oxygen-dependent protoporphyrinogen oxidase
MNDAKQTDVVVVGAGISGLSLTHYLRRRGFEVELLECADRAGGKIHTHRQGNFLVEHGPSSLLETSSRLGELIANLGIGQEQIYTSCLAKNRYVARDGSLHPLPLNPAALIRSKLFSTGAKLKLLREPFVRPQSAGGPESLAAFVERRLGREFLDYAIDPFVAGIFAGTPEKLGVESAFPKLFALEREYGSLIKGALLGGRKRHKQAGTSKQKARMFAFRQGMGTLVDALAADVSDSLRLGVRPREIEEADDGYVVAVEGASGSWRIRTRSLAFAMPAHAYANLSFRFDFPVGASLSRIIYPPVNVVFFGYQDPPGGRTLDGFGFLIPRRENRKILGTSWNSSLFPGRAPEQGVALTTFVGGTRQPQVAMLENDELVDLVRAELRELLGIAGAPQEVRVIRWPRAIPQYGLEHGAITAELEAFEQRHPGIYLTGNFRNGISAPDCVEQSHRLSTQIAEFLAVDSI